jgi:hypothetical protein
MKQLDDIIAQASAAIEPVYFHLPIAGRDLPILRERVYTYELYHQMRCRWPRQIQLVLSGEVDKQGHEIIRALGARAAAPDLLVHGPGNMGLNHAIIEVKPSHADTVGIAKDLLTLSQFRVMVGYERAIYLFYGDDVPERRLNAVAERLGALPQIELWHHAAVGEPARRVGTLGAAA